MLAAKLILSVFCYIAVEKTCEYNGYTYKVREIIHICITHNSAFIVQYINTL